MRSFLFGALGALVAIAAFLLGVHTRQPNRYKLFNAPFTDRTFIFDNQTGKMRRYYANLSGNQITSEGIETINYSDPPDELKKSIDDELRAAGFEWDGKAWVKKSTR